MLQGGQREVSAEESLRVGFAKRPGTRSSADLQAIARCLKGVGWFESKFGASENFDSLLWAFAEIVVRRVVLSGEVLMKEGDKGDFMVSARSLSVKVSLRSPLPP